MLTDSRTKPFVSAHARAQWSIFALLASIATDVVFVASLYSLMNLVTRSLAGESVSLAEALDHEQRIQTLALVQTLGLLITALLFQAWLDRTWENLAALGAHDLKYRKAWGFFGFLIPIVNFFRPYQFVEEIWKASDPDVGVSTRDVRDRASTTSVLAVWWGLWLLTNLIGRLMSGNTDPNPTLGQLQLQIEGLVLFEACRIAAAVSAILVIRAVDRRQEEKNNRVLSGELVLGRSPTPAFAPLVVGTQPALASAEEYFQRGVESYDADDYAQAIADFDQCIRLDPNDTGAYFYRGLAHYAQERYDQAISDLDTVVRLDPRNAEAYYWRGVVYAESAEKAKAIFALENAIRLDLEPELRQEADKLIEQMQRR